MSTIDAVRAGPELMQRWRRQIGGQRRRRERRGQRPYAAISYVARGPSQDGLVDLRRVSFLVLQDSQRQDGSFATRFRSYAAGAVPWGIRIGGAENTRFDKDLALAPRRNAVGQTFSLDDSEFLGLGLDLDRYLERRFSLPRQFHLEPRLPALWVALAPAMAEDVRCAGPEFEAAGRQAVLRKLPGSGAELFPLEFVSHKWRRFARLLVDLRSIPKRQLVPIDQRATNLASFSGAVEFDLCHFPFVPTDVAFGSRARQRRLS